MLVADSYYQAIHLAAQLEFQDHYKQQLFEKGIDARLLPMDEFGGEALEFGDNVVLGSNLLPSGNMRVEKEFASQLDYDSALALTFNGLENFFQPVEEATDMMSLEDEFGLDSEPMAFLESELFKRLDS